MLQKDIKGADLCTTHTVHANLLMQLEIDGHG